MANAYLEWDEGGYWQKALNAVGNAASVSTLGRIATSYDPRNQDTLLIRTHLIRTLSKVVSHITPSLLPTGLANSEHCHPAGLLLKTNILLHHEQEGSLERLQVQLSGPSSLSLLS